MDIKIIADNKNNAHKKSLNNNFSALTIINNATNFKWGFPLSNHGTSNKLLKNKILYIKQFYHLTVL